MKDSDIKLCRIIRRYTELEVWRQARSLASEIYELTTIYPKVEQFGLISQMRRSVVSIPSNIAEGCGRHIKRKQLNFFNLQGSLYELETQLYISKDLNYISAEQLTNCLFKIGNLGKLINGFISTQNVNFWVRML